MSFEVLRAKNNRRYRTTANKSRHVPLKNATSSFLLLRYYWKKRSCEKLHGHFFFNPASGLIMIPLFLVCAQFKLLLEFFWKRTIPPGPTARFSIFPPPRHFWSAAAYIQNLGYYCVHNYDSTFEETRQYFLTTFCMLQYNFRGFAARWIINVVVVKDKIITN